MYAIRIWPENKAEIERMAEARGMTQSEMGRYIFGRGMEVVRKERPAR